ncbi:MAG TPA: molybdopterin molybdotransferase MoeA [Saprospiraceae bacterium]|nr:molybdopterin molybdotransferase MoeA [Saprospiraceae bacterium]
MSKYMIPHTEAIDIICKQTEALAPIRKPILETLGLVLAEDVYSPIDIPGFNQSAMDGYALCIGNEPVKPSYIIGGEVAAGDAPEDVIDSSVAVRIFTGAAVPRGFDTVVMQEKTRVEKGILFITDDLVATGQNVRLQGAEVKSGTLALPKGSFLTPASIGYLAGMGIREISVVPKPKVALIITGNELKKPGEPLGYGQVYDANSYTLTAALRQKGISNIDVVWVRDDLDSLTEVLNVAVETCDLVLLTGGISVGKYDYVLEATQKNEVDLQFYKVKQRPGKPIYFGTKNKALVFGLPGNPASVLTCFYVYVSMAIDLLSNHEKQTWTKATLMEPYAKTNGLTHFLKGQYVDGRVKFLGGQESFRLSSFAEANCLIRIDESTTAIVSGSEVEILLLPK